MRTAPSKCIASALGVAQADPIAGKVSSRLGLAGLGITVIQIMTTDEGAELLPNVGGHPTSA